MSILRIIAIGVALYPSVYPGLGYERNLYNKVDDKIDREGDEIRAVDVREVKYKIFKYRNSKLCQTILDAVNKTEENTETGSKNTSYIDTVLRNKLSLRWTAFKTPISPRPAAITMADINGDGKFEVIYRVVLSLAGRDHFALFFKETGALVPENGVLDLRNLNRINIIGDGPNRTVSTEVNVPSRYMVDLLKVDSRVYIVIATLSKEDETFDLIILRQNVDGKQDMKCVLRKVML